MKRCSTGFGRKVGNVFRPRASGERVTTKTGKAQRGKQRVKTLNHGWQFGYVSQKQMNASIISSLCTCEMRFQRESKQILETLSWNRYTWKRIWDEIDELVYRLKISRVTLPNNTTNSKDVLLKRNNQSWQGGFQGQPGMRTKQCGQNIFKIINQTHFATKNPQVYTTMSIN